jgi:hypothetical protein
VHLLERRLLPDVSDGHLVLSGELAELGVLLLEKSQAIETLRGEALKLELIEIQNKVDDLRKALFANKLLAK